MDDLISRQAALDALKYETDYLTSAYICNGQTFLYKESAIEQISALPPVQPKRGKWIERGTWSEGYGMGESYGKYWACDQCGREVKGFWNECGNNFCSNCGADMRERGVSNADNG